MSDKDRIEVSAPPDVLEVSEPPTIESGSNVDEAAGRLGGLGDTEIGAQPRNLIDFVKVQAPRSFIDLVRGTAQAFTSPVDTARSVGNLLAPNTARRLGESGLNPLQEAFREEQAERISNPGRTLYEDPFGAAADLSTLAGGAGGLLSRVPRTAALGSRLSSVASTIDPLAATARKGLQVGRLTSAGTKKVVGPVLGATTGRGRIPEIMLERSVSPRFKEAMRGASSWQEVVETAKDVARRVAEKRGMEYRAKLDAIGESGLEVPLQPVRDKVPELLERHRMKLRDVSPSPENPTGGSVLDASVRNMSDAGVEQVQRALKKLDEWPSEKAVDVDSLKQLIGKEAGASADGDAFIYALEGEIRDQLESRVPGYRQLTKPYREATRNLKRMNDELSLRGQEGTSVRKLANALTGADDYRQTVLEMMEEYGEAGLVDEIMGLSMRPKMPTGIMRPLTAASIIYSTGAGLSSFPIGLLASSPRLVGEALYALSALRNKSASLGVRLPDSPGAIVYRPLEVASETGEDEAEESPTLDLSHLAPQP